MSYLHIHQDVPKHKQFRNIHMFQNTGGYLALLDVKKKLKICVLSYKHTCIPHVIHDTFNLCCLSSKAQVSMRTSTDMNGQMVKRLIQHDLG